MNDQQKAIFEGACTIMSGLIAKGSVNINNDVERENGVKYAISKSATLYAQTLVAIK